MGWGYCLVGSLWAGCSDDRGTHKDEGNVLCIIYISGADPEIF